MGAATITLDDSAFGAGDAAGGWIIRATGALSTTYLNGTGDSVTAAQFGIGTITKMLDASAGGYVFRFNSTNSTIQAYYTGAGANQVLNEVTNATNLSAVTFDIVAWGY